MSKRERLIRSRSTSIPVWTFAGTLTVAQVKQLFQVLKTVQQGSFVKLNLDYFLNFRVQLETQQSFSLRTPVNNIKPMSYNLVRAASESLRHHKVNSLL